MFTRRALLASAAPLVLVGCTATQEAQFAQNWSNFVDRVNQILAKGCGALPGFTATANSIEAVVSAFYPSLAAGIAAGAAAVQAVASTICSAVPAAPPAALSHKLRANTSAGVASFVGNVTVNGRVIPITGYATR